MSNRINPSRPLQPVSLIKPVFGSNPRQEPEDAFLETTSIIASASEKLPTTPPLAPPIQRHTKTFRGRVLDWLGLTSLLLMFVYGYDLSTQNVRLKEQLNKANTEQAEQIQRLQSSIIALNNTETSELDTVLIDREKQAAVQLLINGGDAGGSGRYVGRKGRYSYFLTAYHVVDGAKGSHPLLSHLARQTTPLTGIQVKTYGSDQLHDAHLVLTDPNLDLALVRAEIPFYSPPEPDYRNFVEDPIAMGETIFLMGCPMGAFNEAITTKGIVCNEDPLLNTDNDKKIGKDIESIITDATLSTGNSGGFAFDSKGRFIGVPYAEYTNPSSAASERVIVQIQYKTGHGLIVPIHQVQEFLVRSRMLDPDDVPQKPSRRPIIQDMPVLRLLPFNPSDNQNNTP